MNKDAAGGDAIDTKKAQWTEYLQSSPEIRQSWSDTVAFIDGVFTSFHSIEPDTVPADRLRTRLQTALVSAHGAITISNGYIHDQDAFVSHNSVEDAMATYVPQCVNRISKRMKRDVEGAFYVFVDNFILQPSSEKALEATVNIMDDLGWNKDEVLDFFNSLIVPPPIPDEIIWMIKNPLPDGAICYDLTFPGKSTKGKDYFSDAMLALEQTREGLIQRVDDPSKPMRLLSWLIATPEHFHDLFPNNVEGVIQYVSHIDTEELLLNQIDQHDITNWAEKDLVLATTLADLSLSRSELKKFFQTGKLPELGLLIMEGSSFFNYSQE